MKKSSMTSPSGQKPNGGGKKKKVSPVAAAAKKAYGKSGGY
jgi:hypothetical protein